MRLSSFSFACVASFMNVVWKFLSKVGLHEDTVGFVESLGVVLTLFTNTMRLTVLGLSGTWFFVVRVRDLLGQGLAWISGPLLPTRARSAGRIRGVTGFAWFDKLVFTKFGLQNTTGLGTGAGALGRSERDAQSVTSPVCDRSEPGQSLALEAVFPANSSRSTSRSELEELQT